MTISIETDIVHDQDGEVWECQWKREEGYPATRPTRVRLRKHDSESWTHFYDALFAADSFKPSMIDYKFRARPL